ncbi:MAG TPA: exodeoxyribonuclease VII small subunit [Thermoplasmatales archaeon]|nr:exodeoxyribonuclease VII small subunit [Thermoplasmatales archaeon]
MQNEGKEEEMKFETALEKLEEIVEELEKGELPLEETIKKFEEGIMLCRICKEKLERAEAKIEELTDWL